jgi:sterol desaturase/sphingolipid hydroxylase (fatty acid hydroxylase superfamily)
MWGFVVAATALALMERLPRLRFRPARLLRPHFATDVVYFLTGWVALGVAGAAGVGVASAWFGVRSGLPAFWTAVPFAAQIGATLVALDLGNYVAHWLLHRVDALWELHKVHHSSPHLDWLATFRSHLVEQALRRAVAPLLLVAAGMPAAAVGVAAALFLGWAMLNHSNVTLPLGALERVLVTPRLHRIHHIPGTTERNLGTVFVWWDRLRGTLVLGDPAPVAAFGFPRQPATYPQDWCRQLVVPFRIGTAA